MRPTVRSLFFLLVFVAGAYAVAEDITLTTYYPSPRGVYQSLQTTGATNLGTNGGVGVVTIGTVVTPAATLDVNGTIQADGLTINPGDLTVTGTLTVQGTTTLTALTSCNGGPPSNCQLATDGSGKVIRGIDADTVVGNEVTSVTAGAGLGGGGGPGPITLNVKTGSGIITSGSQVVLHHPALGCGGVQVLRSVNLDTGSTTCITPVVSGTVRQLRQGTNITLSGAGVSGAPPHWIPTSGPATIAAAALPASPATNAICADGYFSRGVQPNNNADCRRGLFLQAGTGIGFTVGGAPVASTYASRTTTLVISSSGAGSGPCTIRAGAIASTSTAMCLPTETLVGGGCGFGNTGGNNNFNYPVTGPGSPAPSGTSTVGLGYECNNSGDNATATAICCQ